MNSPDQHLSADVLDELISADIDGEFDRAATELGFEPSAARAAMEGTPGGAARRDALMRARSVFSTPPPLDPEREAMLVADALAAADARAARPAPTRLRRHRVQNAWRTVAAVGAAAAVIAGIVTIAGTKPGGEAKSASSTKGIAGDVAAPNKPRQQAKRALIAFGDVSAREALRTKVRDQLAATLSLPSGAYDKAATPAAVAQSGAIREAEGDRAVTPNADAAGAARQRAQTCITSLVASAHLRSAPVLSGTGTSGARPVYVVVFTEGGTRLVYVLSAVNCTVVTRATLP
jgi:hypothetical protein